MEDNQPDFDWKRKIIEKMFAEKVENLSIEAKLDLDFIERRPIADENVYGEAFPEEGRVKLEVFAPETTDKEIEWNICHELVHIKHPELSHNDPQFNEEVKQYLKKNTERNEKINGY